MTSSGLHVSTHHSPTRRRVGTLGVALGALMGGALAFAAWTSNGTGDSQDVIAGSAGALTVAPVTPAVTGLVPGASEDSAFTVSNANDYEITLSTATVDGFAVTGGTGCTVGNSGVTAVINPAAVGTAVPGGGTPEASANFTVTLTMGPTSDNGCQGATFTPEVSVAGASS